jgi:ABC-type multidrug transport system fused ATPase/permease subunit
MYQQESLRQQISFVLQETLLSASVLSLAVLAAHPGFA